MIRLHSTVLVSLPPDSLNRTQFSFIRFQHCSIAQYVGNMQMKWDTLGYFIAKNGARRGWGIFFPIFFLSIRFTCTWYIRPNAFGIFITYMEENVANTNWNCRHKLFWPLIGGIPTEPFRDCNNDKSIVCILVYNTRSTALQKNIWVNVHAPIGRFDSVE